MLGYKSQSSVTGIEKAPTEEGHTKLTIDQIVAIEDHFDVMRGTVLRSAGYVVDAVTPPQQIDSWWWFLNEQTRLILHQIVDDAWKEKLAERQADGESEARPSAPDGQRRSSP